MVLDQKRNEDIVNRLLNDETILQINNTLYRIKNPSPKLNVLASIEYDNAIKTNRFNRWLRDSQCLAILVRQGLCDFNIDQNIKTINDRIDELKLELYNSYGRKDQFKRVRKNLEAVRKKYNTMYGVRHMLDHCTLQGYAEMIKRQYIIYKTLYHINGKRVWSRFEDISMTLMDIVILRLVQQTPTTSDIRYVVRNEPWKTVWSVTKGRPYRMSIGQMNDEQKLSVMFSSMYDNIYKHPECPSDNIINDDDLLDGWLMSERKKNKDKSVDRSIKNRQKSRHGDADELYISPTGGENRQPTKDEIKSVNDLNSTESKIIKKQRAAQIKKQGEVKESQLFDRKVQIQNQSNKQFMEQIKGKK